MRKLAPIFCGILTLLALSAALVLYVVYPDPIPVYVAFALTAVFALAWAWEGRVALRAFLTRRSTYYGANVAFIVALILGILVFLNVIAKDHHWRADLTKSGVNSLSPQSEKILKSLPQKVKAYYFSSLQEKERGEPIFLNYVYETKNFEYEFVDTARRPTFVASMDVKKNETFVLVLEGTSKKVKVEGISEEKITNGLIKLLQSKEETVYFTTGHGERALDGETNGGFSLAKSELEKQGYTVKELNLFSEGKIPADSAALVVAGPTRAFFPKELELLAAWLKNGGRAIFALDLDPASDGLAKGSQQIAELLKAYGLEVQNKMLVDPTSKAANVEPQVLLGFSGSKDHPVSKDFPFSTMAANFLFPLTTYIDGKAAPGYIRTPLAITSQNAWAESDWSSLKSGLVSYQEGKDHKGQMVLALAVEEEKPEAGKGDANKKLGRFVVFAASSFAADTLIDKVGNRDLFLNSVAWLADNEQLISIRAKEGEELGNFNGNILNLVLLLTVFVLPVLIAVAGVVVWLRRSKL